MMFLLVRWNVKFVCSMTLLVLDKNPPPAARHEESKALREHVLSEYLGDSTNQRKVGPQIPTNFTDKFPPKLRIESDWTYVDREIPQ